ncbi:uncharacterized protein LOC135346573 [Halichondria panicea]|uniref:uncharacterized protein LOC135346573 n=1 Tax=Halichondria panicea TaxID=6063 RepID=UPI00312B7965
MSSCWQPKDDFWFNVTFIYHKETITHSSVYLTGDFNGWSCSQHLMVACSEGYTVTLSLCTGFYHYKFFSDDAWFHDDHNPHRGGERGNSVMFVHMDPTVYGLRPQSPPHRDYHRPETPRNHFHTLSPSLTADIAAHGILQRLVFVYLPPSYSSDPTRRYPVVYANDGQNLFSTPEHCGGPCMGGWAMDAHCDHHWTQGTLPEFILVAVPNSDFVCIGNRTKEYCTADFQDTSQDPYICYLVEVVKRDIDATYRTLPDPCHTVAMGSSNGGLCAFVCAVNHSQVFGGAVCMSPSFWHVDRDNHAAYSLVQSRPQPPSRLYIDSGDGLGDNRYDVKMMSDTLTRCGWKHKYLLDECASRMPHGMTHLETAWGARVLDALKYVLDS